ncbi:MAG: hypothetical protein ACFB6S_00860 [Geminicoccaceae bacterium]
MIGVVVGLPAEARCLPEAPRISVRVAAGSSQDTHQAVSSLIERNPALLISFGVCAGLDPSLKPGDLVIATHVMTLSAGRWPTDPAFSDRIASALGGSVQGPALTVDKPVTDPTTKARLFENTGAIIADMESACVVSAAAHANIPPVVLRAVLDPAERGVPPAALAGGPKGGSAHGVLKALLWRPGDVPALARLAVDYARALRTLRRAGPILAGLSD